MKSNQQTEQTAVSDGLRAYDTVSFDIFDTLVHRYTYAPMDVFDAVRSKLMCSQTALLHPQLIANFPQLRRNGEQAARERRIAAFGGDAEINFDEIYDEMQQRCPFDAETRKLLQQTELDLEKLFLYRSNGGFERYSAALSAGKQILFISDMYLPQSFLIEMLNGLGYAAANEHTLFVSADHRCNKHSGGLYRLVQEKLRLNPKKWLHFGDNMHADIESARKAGLSSQHADWSSVRNVPRHSPNIADALPQSIIEGLSLPQHQAVYTPENAYQEQGYRIFAPLVFGFYVWLLKNLQTYQADKILFFARDAYLIQQIHELLEPDFPIPHEYVYVSRKSIYPMSLTDFPLHRMDFLVGSRLARPLSSICRNYNINLEQHSVTLAKFGLTPETPITPQNHHLATQFMATCFEDLMNGSISNRNRFGGYFTRMLENCRKVAVVDIGWAGSIQSALARVAAEQSPETELSGFYLGLFPHASRNIRNKCAMTGYLVNLNQHAENQEVLTKGGIELLEFLLTSPEGSTVGYQQDAQGSINPVLEKKNSEEQDYEYKATEVQKGVLAFMQDYAFLLKTFPLDALNSLKWMEPFRELVLNPSREQIRLFADLTHSDGAGDNQSRMALAEKMPLFDRLLRTKKYKRAYESAFWKKAFYYRNNRSPKKYRG